MADSEVFLSVALGTFIAVVYPSVYRYVRREFPPTAAPGIPPWLKDALKKYGALLAFSLITALIVIAAYRSANPGAAIGFWTAVAMGFGWEASVEKLVFPKSQA